jgi:hypothetical protein
MERNRYGMNDVRYTEIVRAELLAAERSAVVLKVAVGM